MEKILRYTSGLFFGLNYAGVAYGGLTFIKESEEKQWVFKKTCCVHLLFLLNNYALSYLKLRVYPHYLGLQCLNDVGCAIYCLPVYALWVKHSQLLSSFTKTEDNQINLQELD